jgi:hypothetical protein
MPSTELHSRVFIATFRSATNNDTSDVALSDQWLSLERIHKNLHEQPNVITDETQLIVRRLHLKAVVLTVLLIWK